MINSAKKHIYTLGGHLLSLIVGGFFAYIVIFFLQLQGLKTANIADIITGPSDGTLKICYGYDTEGIFGIFGTNTYTFASGSSMRAMIRYDDIYTGDIRVANDRGFVQGHTVSSGTISIQIMTSSKTLTARHDILSIYTQTGSDVSYIPESIQTFTQSGDIDFISLSPCTYLEQKDSYHGKK